MTQAYAYTEERIRLPTPADSPNPELTERMISIIQRFGQTGDRDAVDREFHELKNDVWGTHGFGAAGDSNSVWGKQERLASQPAISGEDKETVIENLEAVGFILQDRDPYGDMMECDGLYVFVPKLERYLPINYPWQRLPSVNVRVLTYDSPHRDWYDYGIAASNQRLTALLNEFSLHEDRRDHGHIYPDASLDEIQDVLEAHDLSYAVHNASINRVPTIEWFPEDERRNRVVCKYSPAYRFDNSRAHSIGDTDLTAACGAVTPTDENVCVVSEETATRRMNLQSCNHVACK